MKKEISSKERNNLYKAFSVAINDQSLFEKFLKDILTPSEYNEIHTRLEIVSMLYKGSTHRNVSDELSIGVGTVNRGALELKDKNGGFYEVLERLNLKK